MTTAADYEGRAYDVSAFHGQRPRGDAPLDQVLADAPGGEICVGVVKLAQRFLLELLTVRGSMPFRPERGCDFMSDVLSGRLRAPLDVFTAFAFAAGTIGRNLRGDALAADAADERYAGAVLEAVALEPGIARLTISVTSVAGTARRALLPIRTPY